MTRDSGSMASLRALDNTKLLEMLGDLLKKEKTTWTPRNFKKLETSGLEVSPGERDEMVRWLIELCDRFHFYPETFALAVACLDRFLNTVKVRPKYLTCTTITCLYLASKTLEEDEVVPGTRDFLDESECDCSVAEVLRMEKSILDKLKWDLLSVTTMEFLSVVHSLLMNSYPLLLDGCGLTEAQQLTILTYKARLCLAYYQLLPFKPSTVALALVTLELELFRPDWLVMAVTLQKLLKVDSPHLIRCREIISRHLTQERTRGHPYHMSMKKTSKRKVDHIEVDDIYDSIKRLYSEETSEVNCTVSVARVSCRAEALDGNVNNTVLSTADVCAT